MIEPHHCALCDPSSSEIATRVNFDRVIGYGFYDGPTSGLLRCQECLKWYAFAMLDWDVDTGKDRILGLSLLRNSTVEPLLQLISVNSIKPAWPYWLDHYKLDSALAKRVAAEIEEAMSSALRIDALVEIDNGYIIESKRFTLVHLNQVVVPGGAINGGPLEHDWFDREEATRNWRELLKSDKTGRQ